MIPRALVVLPSTNGHGDGSHNSDTGIRGTVRTPYEYTYKDFLNCKPLTFKGAKGVVVLSQWLRKKKGRWNQCSISATVLWRTKLSLLLAPSLEGTKDVAYAMD
ncbi:hypothetical protein Tco_0307170 [Tanacetum coccineum]